MGRIEALHTAVPGRARLRVAGLRRNAALARRLDACLAGAPGVTAWETSILTGRVLVRFHRDSALGDILQWLEGRLAGTGPPDEAPGPSAPRRLSQRSGDGSSPAGNGHAWHALAGHRALELLESIRGDGLSRDEAAGRLARYGPNRLPRSRRRPYLEILGSQFLTPPVALLGVSSVVAILTGGLLDAGVIVTVVLINAAIGSITEQQAEGTISGLERLTPPQARVVRDGETREIPSEELVPGDILRLAPGSPIPADGRLLAADELSVDESTLTGESMPVLKDADAELEADEALAGRVNMVYMGTTATGGSGIAVVAATGSATEYGNITGLVGTARPPPTPMERQLDDMGRQLAWLSGAVCAGVFAVGLLRGYGWLAMLKAAISLAVAAVPEGLPTVATTTLALGIRDMGRRKVLVRQLAAVETLGSVQVLCLDKTGTLTQNRMGVVEARTGEDTVRIEDGRFLVDGEAIEPGGQPVLRRLMEVAALCNDVEITHDDDGPGFDGSPTEGALVELALAAGIDVKALRADSPRCDVQHRSQERKYMVTVHDTGRGRRLVAVKGSPEQVLEACSQRLEADGARHLEDDHREAIKVANDTMARSALRVLGVACGERDDDGSLNDHDLTWLGLVGMMDPLRPGMEKLLAQFHDAGIETVMITGDQTSTAYAIARQLDIGGGRSMEILDSARLDRMDPELLAGVVGDVQVFARVSPSHKLQIVQALQRAGRVVAMTGDGVNDGPALKAADLGVAMGAGGSEAASSVADVVIRDDNLHTLVEALRQGRTIYNNIRKSLRFLLSTNFTEIEVMLAGIALGLGPPLNSMQLLWINLFSDIAPGLALAMEPAEGDVLKDPPRSPDTPIIARGDLARLTRESLIISGGALAAYLYAISRYGPGPRAGTHAFVTLTVGQLLHALSCRSEIHGMFHPGRLPGNRHLRRALAASLGAQLLTVSVPGLRRLLGTTPVGLTDALVMGVGAVAPLVANEALKTRNGSGRDGNGHDRGARAPEEESR